MVAMITAITASFLISLPIVAEIFSDEICVVIHTEVLSQLLSFRELLSSRSRVLVLMMT